MISGALQSRALARLAPILPPARVRDYIRVEAVATPARITIAAIKRAVAEHYEITVAAMDGQARHRWIVRPRQVAIYLTFDLTQKPSTQIGQAFGGRDHSTALHAQTVIADLLPRDDKLRADLATIRAEIARAARWGGL